ncbi:MAG: cysteine desulfurase [Clostridia bacterium]|nr:cysteine desulfurase [Clostridia bacterium]
MNDKKTIYLDHAATTPLDPEVFEKMKPYFCELFGNADSPHGLGRKSMLAVDGARDTVARLIGAKPSEVYFTSGGTESDNWAILGGAYAKKREGKTRILISSIEHHAALSAAERLEKEGFIIDYIPVNEGGRVEPTAVKERLDDSVALVCVMAANNETGAIQPVREIAELVRNHGALFFTDCVQLAPYRKLDVQELGADLLSFSAHKFFGPKGVGVLYIRDGVKMEKLVGGGEQERGLRGGTLNVPSVVGLAAAYDLAVRGLDETEKKLASLKARFLNGIDALGGVAVNGDSENALPAVLNLRIEGVENTAFLFNMDLQGVAIAAGSACASASVKPSHVLLAMGLSESQAKTCVRISFGKDNTEAEIDEAAKIFVATVNRLRALN